MSHRYAQLESPRPYATIPDGVFTEDASGQLRFHRLPRPTPAEMSSLGMRVIRQTHKRLSREDLDSEWDTSAHAAVFAESANAGGPRSDKDEKAQKGISVLLDGFSIHASGALHESNRQGLEKMLRYGARPAIAQERLSYDGHVVRYRPKGAREELVFSPPVFLRRLAALIPPPRQHMTRFHGVFAPRSRFRRVVVPKESQAAKVPLSEPLPPRLRAEWAELLKRVFEVDLRVCGVCGGRRRVIATIRDPDVVQAIVTHLATNAGERSRAPPGWVSDSEQEASVR